MSFIYSCSFPLIHLVGGCHVTSQLPCPIIHPFFCLASHDTTQSASHPLHLWLAIMMPAHPHSPSLWLYVIVPVRPPLTPLLCTGCHGLSNLYVTLCIIYASVMHINLHVEGFKVFFYLLLVVFPLPHILAFGVCNIKLLFVTILNESRRTETAIEI